MSDIQKPVFFTDDGVFGNAEHIFITNTADWTPPMWQAIEEERDTARSSLASHFTSKFHLWKDEMCMMCGLTPHELDLAEAN